MKTHFVAIVEDDCSAREALLSLVGALGFAVEGFASAEAFLNVANLDAVLCLIADIRLPGMSGIQLHHHLRQSAHPVPMVLVTAYPDAATARAALEAGALAYLAKPVPPEALLACLQAALSGQPSRFIPTHDGRATASLSTNSPAPTRDAVMPTASTTPGKALLDPANHALVMIDFQSQMAFATKSIDVVNLRNNAALVAHAAAGFGVSTILTTVAEKSFSGPMFSEIAEAFPGRAMLDRTSMNSWEDAAVIAKVNELGKSRIVLAGLWTSVCIVGPALSAIDQGFEVCVIADACGDVSTEAHDRAMDRMVQAGAQPMTSLQYLLELQRDWARAETYDFTTGTAKRFGGAYGLGIIYAKTMFGASEGH